MADITVPSDWIISGRSTYAEFNEVVITGSDGTVTTQKLQKRNVYQFSRTRIEPTAWIGGSLPDTDAGDQAGPTLLDAYQGSQEINAGTISTGETQIYVCVKDDHISEGVGGKWLMREQVWEMRGLWADYDWPVGP